MQYLGHKRWTLNEQEEFISHRYNDLLDRGYTPAQAGIATMTSMRGMILISLEFIPWLTDGVLVIDPVTGNLIRNN